jgi:putative RecB family exonuclease
MSDNLKLSVSKCKTYDSCHKQFHFSYILKIPKQEESYHILGKFCHKVLEDFHIAYMNDCKDLYKDTMTTAFKNACVEFKDGMTKEMKKEAFYMLYEYLKKIENKKMPHIVGCEKPFSLPIEENVILNGVIDRVQIDDDGVLHVADYKTTKNKTYLKDDWTQLLTYMYVLIDEYPNDQIFRGSYVLLRHNFEYITKEFTKDEVLKVKEKYISYANQIKNEKEYKPNITKLCGWCPYKEICDEYKESKKLTFGIINY